MNMLFCALVVLPLRLVAQIDTLTPPPSSRNTNLLKLIEYREIPYTYTSHSTTTSRGRTTTTSSVRSGIHRIYSYDGIDIDNPQHELWQYMDAVNDPNVVQQHQEFTDMVSRESQGTSIGVGLMVPGLLMLIAGGSQARAHQQAVTRQRPTTTAPTAPVPGGPTLSNCSVWTESGNHWACQSGPYSGQTISTNPFSTASTVTVPPVQSSTSSTVATSDGTGLLIGGTLFLLAGTFVMIGSVGNQDSAFLKAVQYYNRALKQKFSWEMQPSYQSGAVGLRLVGHF